MIRARGSYAGLTVKQADLLSFLRVERDRGRTPSYEQMAAALDLRSKSGIGRLVSALEERGFVTRLENRARSIRVNDEPTSYKPTVGQLKDVPVEALLSALLERGFKVTVS